MSSMRKIISLLLTVALGLFAGLAVASSSPKFFYAVFPKSLVVAGPNTLQVFNSTPPPGVSTINSMQITAPAGVMITSISPGSLQSSPCSTCVVNNIPGINSGQTGTFTLTVSAGAGACVSGMWGIAANTGNAYPKGDPFVDQHPAAENLSYAGCEYIGQATCGGAAASVSTCTLVNGQLPSQPGCASIAVSPSYKTGNTCSDTFNFDALNTLLFNNTLSLDLTGTNASNAAFVLMASSSPLQVDASGYASRRVKVAWQKDGNGIPIYIFGSACLQSGPPSPYGTLAAGILVGDSTIQVNLGAGVVLPPGPFPVIIGTERLQVTGVSGSGPYTFAVLRHQGGTTAAPHSQNDTVASTPMPIETATTLPDGVTPDPYTGQQVHVCVSDYEWMSAGINPAGQTVVIYFATVIAIGGDPQVDW